MRSTILSEPHHENILVAAANKKAMIIPLLPPKAEPTTMKSAVMAASSKKVRSKFIDIQTFPPHAAWLISWYLNGPVSIAEK
jgi:hypothetical protein